MPYKHLFFDLDHTLWDFEANSREALYDLFHKYDLDKTLTDDFNDFCQRYSEHNKRLWNRYHHGHIKQEELRWKRMWHTLLDYNNGSELLAKKLSAEYLEILPTKKVIFPHTKEILDYLSNKKYILHLITNGFENTQQCKLRNSGLGKYFTHIITSERAMAIKPQKEIFEFALQLANAIKEECIMIGDNLDADIKGGMDAGLDTIFVNHINELTNLNPTYTIYHLQELEKIL